MRRFFIQVIVLLLLALICSAIANLIAGRTRKLAWFGNYSVETLAPILKYQPPAPVTPQPKIPPKKVQPPQVIPPKTTPPITSPWITQIYPPHPERPWTPASSEQAWDLFQRGALILDARRTDDYTQGHIAHARNFAVWEADVDFKVQALREEFPPDAPIVAYCSGGDCEDSRMLAEKLRAAGFTNVRVYEEGFPDWQQKGRPTESGAGR